MVRSVRCTRCERIFEDLGEFDRHNCPGNSRVKRLFTDGGVREGFSQTRGPASHLDARPAGRAGGQLLGTSKHREWYCQECSCRITISRDGEREYGHKRDCSHKYDGGVLE